MSIEPNASITPHLPTLEMLVTSNNLKRVIEIGVCKGNSTLTFLRALNKTNGRLVSIDKEPLTIALSLIKNPNWKFIQSLSQHVKIDFKSIDLLFIDSEHSEIQLKTELHMFAPFVRSGGFIVMHDINKTCNAEMYPAYSKFLTEHPDYKVWYYENSQGLAVIQVV